MPVVEGTRVWLSPYDVRFEDPAIGDRKSVGDLQLEVAWPLIQIKSSKPVWASVMKNVAKGFRYELKPGVPPISAIGAGGGGGGSYSTRLGKRKGWCRCPEGPVPVTKKNRKVSTELSIYTTGAGSYTIDQIKLIKMIVSKPIEEPYQAEGPALRP